MGSPALHQSIAFLLIIGIGILLKFRIKDKSELKGVKVIILTVALPATIFIALMKINLKWEMISLPILALLLNGLLFLICQYIVLPLFEHRNPKNQKRTLLLLFASFAPGLSCLPFIAEYFGDDPMAKAALADIGNKIFVLIILYLLAMKWYYGNQAITIAANSKKKFQGLILSLVKEPVNAIIVIALVLLLLGLNFETLPLFFQDLIKKTHALTTGMVLLFIGAAVSVNSYQAKRVFSLLFIRSAFGFLLSAILLFITQNIILSSSTMIWVLLPQSSVSFWPFSHMASVDSMESEKADDKRTFDLQHGLNILACSLPLSTLLILGICSTGDFFLHPVYCLIAAIFMLFIGLVLRVPTDLLFHYSSAISSNEKRLQVHKNN